MRIGLRWLRPGPHTCWAPEAVRPRHPRAALQFPAGLTIRASSLDSTAQFDDATFVESHDHLQSPTPAAGAGSTGSVVRVSARLGWPHDQPGGAHRAHKRVRAFGAVDLFDARLIRSEHDGACRSQGCGNPVLLQLHWVFNGPGCWKQLHDAVRPGPPHDLLRCVSRNLQICSSAARASPSA